MLIAKANLYHFTVIYERILAFGSCCSCGPVLHNISLLPCGPIERAVAPVRYSYCGPWILPHIVSKHLPTSWMGRTRALRLFRKVLCIGNATHYTMSLYCCSNLPVPVLCSRFPCWRGEKNLAGWARLILLSLDSGEPTASTASGASLLVCFAMCSLMKR